MWHIAYMSGTSALKQIGGIDEIIPRRHMTGMVKSAKGLSVQHLGAPGSASTVAELACRQAEEKRKQRWRGQPTWPLPVASPEIASISCCIGGADGRRWRGRLGVAAHFVDAQSISVRNALDDGSRMGGTRHMLCGGSDTF